MPNDTYVEKKEEEYVIPIAAILCFAICFYLIVIMIGLFIRKCLIASIPFLYNQFVCTSRESLEKTAHGYCKNCNPKLGSSKCSSCTSCVYMCDWKLPTVDSCLDTICPAKQRINCIEFLVCDWDNMQCCNEGGTYTCGSGDYSCTCEAPQCDSINCLCCEISFRNVATAQ